MIIAMTKVDNMKCDTLSILERVAIEWPLEGMSGPKWATTVPTVPTVPSLCTPNERLFIRTGI